MKSEKVAAFGWNTAVAMSTTNKKVRCYSASH